MEKKQGEKKIKEPPGPLIHQRKSPPPEALTDQAATTTNLSVHIQAEEEAATDNFPGLPVDLPVREESTTEAATGTSPIQA